MARLAVQSFNRLMLNYKQTQTIINYTSIYYYYDFLKQMRDANECQNTILYNISILYIYIE